MFLFSDLEPQHILTGDQVQTNVAAMEERKKTNEKRDGSRSNAGKRRAKKRRFVDRIISWKIFQPAKANKN